jgi:bifunctional non-homologous end joining protein LigD
MRRRANAGTSSMGLAEYQRKRNFSRTQEPIGSGKKDRGKQPPLLFVVQKHAARRLHYDFRLELDGVLKSWAVPKGPSLDPGVKRFAVHVEDHPIEYAGFEGVIPEGEYGAGTVLIWDHGTWAPEVDPIEAYEQGMLKFELQGERLRGRWMLVRVGQQQKKNYWLLIKERDAEARPGSGDAVLTASDRDILAARERVWQ